MDYATVIRQTGDGVLAALRRAERRTVSTPDQVSDYVPKQLRFRGRFPSPKRVTKAVFRVWENLVVTQRNYTLGLVDAFSPLADVVTSNGRPRRRPARSTKGKRTRSKAKVRASA